MLKTRKFQQSLAQLDVQYGRNPPKEVCLWDRSMTGDYVFALWNHLTGGISQKEMAVYEDGRFRYFFFSFFLFLISLMTPLYLTP